MNKKSISAVLLMGAIVVTSINGCLVKSNANEKSDSNDNFKTTYNKNENIEESNNYVLLTKSNEDYIILNKRDNTEITNVHETVDGVTVKLTAYEALDRLNNNQQIDDTSINESEVEEKETKSTKTFQRTGTSSVTGSATKNVYGDSPKKISTGLCDGLEYLEQRNR